MAEATLQSHVPLTAERARALADALARRLVQAAMFSAVVIGGTHLLWIVRDPPLWIPIACLAVSLLGLWPAAVLAMRDDANACIAGLALGGGIAFASGIELLAFLATATNDVFDKTVTILGLVAMGLGYVLSFSALHATLTMEIARDLERVAASAVSPPSP